VTAKVISLIQRNGCSTIGEAVDVERTEDDDSDSAQDESVV
jgi:hypothetical protein